MSTEVKKRLLGKPNVHYDCPKCQERLVSPLDEAGKKDNCPVCSVEFIVPGETELRKVRDTQRREAEKNEENAAERRAAKRARSLDKKRKAVGKRADRLWRTHEALRSSFNAWDVLTVIFTFFGLVVGLAWFISASGFESVRIGPIEFQVTTIREWLKSSPVALEPLSNLVAMIISIVGAIAASLRARASKQDTSAVQQSRTQGDRNERVHRHLKKVVFMKWVEEGLHQSLYDQMRLRLQFDERADAVQGYPLRMVTSQSGKRGRRIGDFVEVAHYFDDAGQLLILGEPGSGKTTTMLMLLEKLLATNSSEPTTPVVFKLSSWSSEDPLEAWLIKELRHGYRIPASVAQRLVANNELIVLLDGLDEVAKDDRDLCVAAINRFRAERDDIVHMIVCSRRTEYEELVQKLDSAVALEVRPLTRRQVDSYVAAGCEKLRPLAVELSQNSELRKMSRNPLKLNIMALAYADEFEEGSPLPSRPRTPVQRLFDRYIASMFEHHRRKISSRFSPLQTTRWLRWLSCQMSERGQTEFLIEHMQPDLLKGPTRIIHRLTTRLVVPLAGGIAFGMCLRVYFGLDPMISLIFAFSASLLMNAASSEEIVAHDDLNLSWKCGAVGAIQGGFLLGLVGWYGGLPVSAMGLCGAVIGVTMYLPHDLATWPEIKQDLGVVATVTLMFGILGGILGWAFGSVYFGVFIGGWLGAGQSLKGEARSLETEKLRPNQSIIRLSKYAGIAVLATLSFFCSLRFFIGSLTAFDLALGLALGLVIASFYGIEDVWKHVMLRWFLYRAKCMPLNYVDFLDFAASHLFLQKVGGSYVFVHRDLQEHFAALDNDDIDHIVASLSNEHATA